MKSVRMPYMEEVVTAYEQIELEVHLDWRKNVNEPPTHVNVISPHDVIVHRG